MSSTALIGTAVRLLMILEAIVLLAGCAASCRSDVRPAPQYALPPAEMGILSLQERDIQRQHGDKASGFQLLDRNDDGLKWRLALIDSAQYSLDL